MLATILKSPRATQTTIAIIDSFVKLRELIRNVDAIQNEPDLIKQKGIVKRTGQLLSDLLIDDADTTEMESTIELNLMAVKLKHTVKRIKNNNKTEDKSEFRIAKKIQPLSYSYRRMVGFFIGISLAD